MKIGNLALKYKIGLPPAVIMLVLVVLTVTLGFYLNDMRLQNEGVRRWTHALDRMHGALSLGQQLERLAAARANAKGSTDDLQFEYFDQFTVFEEHLRHPELLAKLTATTRETILNQVSRLRDPDKIDALRMRAEWQALLPQLEALHKHFWVQRRAAYIEYYHAVTADISTVLGLMFGSVVLSIVAGFIATRWAVRDITTRIGSMIKGCQTFGNIQIAQRYHDELAELSHCLTQMQGRLVEGINTERVLEGAEDERRRIAMDLHDQALSDLTHLARDLRSLQSDVNPGSRVWHEKYIALAGDLDEAIEGIRRIMDDLHPQTLDSLGFEAALRSYLERKLTRPGYPTWQVYISEDVDRRLDFFQVLTLYRIALEAVNNVARHAHSSRCEIDCRITEDTLIFSVEDNGTGFDWTQADIKAGGRGLSNMTRRANAIGAGLTWSRARFSSGTRFEMRLTLMSDLLASAQHESAA